MASLILINQAVAQPAICKTALQRLTVGPLGPRKSTSSQSAELSRAACCANCYRPIRRRAPKRHGIRKKTGGGRETKHLLQEQIATHRRSIGVFDSFCRMALTLSPEGRDGFSSHSLYPAEPAIPKCRDCLIDPASREPIGDEAGARD